MPNIGDSERKTQNRVVKFFRDKLHYTYLGNLHDSENRNIMQERLHDWLLKQGYSEKLASNAVDALVKTSTNLQQGLYHANKEVYSLLKYGAKVKETVEQSPKTVYFIDFEDVSKNEFYIAEEVTIVSNNTKRPDIVLYVNGIALAVIELKKSSVSVSNGIRQNLTNQKANFIEDFFTTIQFCMAGNDSEGLRYGTLLTPEKHYLEWKDDGFSEHQPERDIVDIEVEEYCEGIPGKLEKQIFALLQSRMSDGFVPIQQVALNVLDKIEQATRSRSVVTGLATGFVDLDYRTSGLQPSDLILIAARPSMGKTAFVLNIADYISVRRQKTCLIFSLEMSKEQLVNRMLAMEANVDSQKLRTGTLTDEDWDSVVEGIGAIGNSKLLIDDTPGISVMELRSKCRKVKLEYGLDLVMIDYLQLMTGSGRSSDNRQQEISEISRSLKALARELNAPVIALSQLSRACETRTDHRPMLSDLRESGAIEQDADVVMFLYRDDYYNKDTDTPNVAEVIIAKQRNGPIGTINLGWKPELTRFVNMAKEQQ